MRRAAPPVILLRIKWYFARKISSMNLVQYVECLQIYLQIFTMNAKNFKEFLKINFFFFSEIRKFFCSTQINVSSNED